MKRALVFDFDGLILDTEWPEYAAWKKVFEDFGQELPIQDWMGAVGRPPGNTDFQQRLEAQLGRTVDWSTVAPGRRAHHQALVAEQEILPGVADLMRQGQARGWALGVASSSSHEWVSGHVKRLGLDAYVQTYRTKSNCTRLKPHPDPYLLACQDLDADPASSFAFEDSAPGVAAARAAGLTVVAVPNRITRHHDLSAAHQRLESLEHFKLPA
jgi:HAD superfamily hydrolase (TIGR01509 family)